MHLSISTSFIDDVMNDVPSILQFLNVTLVISLLSNILLDRLQFSNMQSTRSTLFSSMFVKSMFVNIHVSIVCSFISIFEFIVPFML